MRGMQRCYRSAPRPSNDFRSRFSSGVAYCKALPSCITAASTISRSFFSSGVACCEALPSAPRPQARSHSRSSVPLLRRTGRCQLYSSQLPRDSCEAPRASCEVAARARARGVVLIWDKPPVCGRSVAGCCLAAGRWPRWRPACALPCSTRLVDRTGRAARGPGHCLWPVETAGPGLSPHGGDSVSGADSPPAPRLRRLIRCGHGSGVPTPCSAVHRG